MVVSVPIFEWLLVVKIDNEVCKSISLAVFV